jgi:GAF domain-containing protein
MTDLFSKLLPQLAKSGQPDTMFRALEATTKTLVGHELFTLLYVDDDEVARIYSNRPLEYPVSGRKPMGPTPWGALVLKGGKPFFGPDREAIRWAFFDHALIESMGLGSVINVPVLYNGNTIGTINLLAPERHFREEHVPLLESLAPLLVPAFLNARSEQV